MIIAYNYIKRSFKDFSSLLIMIVMPIVFTFIIGTALEGVANPRIEKFETPYINEDVRSAVNRLMLENPLLIKDM